MTHDEVVGRHVHQAYQPGGLIDDSGAVAPGEEGREEAGYLDVLLPAEQVRDGDGVVGLLSQFVTRVEGGQVGVEVD